MTATTIDGVRLTGCRRLVHRVSFHPGCSDLLHPSSDVPDCRVHGRGSRVWKASTSRRNQSSSLLLWCYSTTTIIIISTQSIHKSDRYILYYCLPVSRGHSWKCMVFLQRRCYSLRSAKHSWGSEAETRYLHSPILLRKMSTLLWTPSVPLVFRL